MREKLIRFMQGRYGADTLSAMLAAIYMLLTIVNIFVGSWIIHLLGCALFVIVVARALSRNIEARQRENAVAVRLLDKFRGFFGGAKKGAVKRDRKNFAYKKCPVCKKTLRLPRSRGRHTTRCPNCKKEFSVRIF